MEAIKLISEYGRMCSFYDSDCEGCPLKVGINSFKRCDIFLIRCPKEAVPIIEKWSKEHPKKTRQDKFLENFPDARKDDNGVIIICPYDIGVTNNCGVDCSDCWECREKYWLAEVDE